MRTISAAAAFANAASFIRLAIAAIRETGANENNGPNGIVVSDLERLCEVCIGRSKPHAPAAPLPPGCCAAAPAPVAPPAPKPMAAPSAAQMTTAPAPAAPKGKRKTVRKPKAPAPCKASGLTAYRQLQAECKALGVSAKGKADELTARLEAARKPAASAAPKAKRPEGDARLSAMAELLGVSVSNLLAAAELAGLRLS